MDIEYVTRREFDHLVEGIVALEKRMGEMQDRIEQLEIDSEPVDKGHEGEYEGNQQ